MNFIAINRAKGTNISSTPRPLLEIKTMSKNKKQRSDQDIKTSGVGF